MQGPPSTIDWVELTCVDYPGDLVTADWRAADWVAAKLAAADLVSAVFLQRID